MKTVGKIVEKIKKLGFYSGACRVQIRIGYFGNLDVTRLQRTFRVQWGFLFRTFRQHARPVYRPCESPCAIKVKFLDVLTEKCEPTSRECDKTQKRIRHRHYVFIAHIRRYRHDFFYFFILHYIWLGVLIYKSRYRCVHNAQSNSFFLKKHVVFIFVDKMFFFFFFYFIPGSFVSTVFRLEKDVFCRKLVVPFVIHQHRSKRHQIQITCNWTLQKKNKS